MQTTTGAVRQSGPDVSHERRDACLHALGALHASGKLSLSELDARIEAALAARTDDELAALVRETSRIEVAPPRPIHEAQASVNPRYRRASGLLFALRRLAFVALTLVAGLARVVTLTLVALSAVIVRALLLLVWLGFLAWGTLVRQSKTWGASIGRADARVVPARRQAPRSASQELVVMPRPQVPAQRQPMKIHPVIVPTQGGSSSSALVRARRSTDVVLPGRAVRRQGVLGRDLASVATVLPREDRTVQALVAQLRPLVHRVTERARWRRLSTNACERAGQTKGWRRTIRSSRAAF